MKKITLIALIICVLGACSKDKFNTNPQIEIHSYNTKVVDPSGTLMIQLKFTDKEGDISEGKFVYIEKRTNRKPPPVNTGYLDSVVSTIPHFIDNTSGYLELTLPWQNLHLSDVENDSLYFRFVAVDRAGNKSDTVNSDRIVVLRQ
jgi:hypothetical protein